MFPKKYIFRKKNTRLKFFRKKKHALKILKEEMKKRGWIEGSTNKHYVRFYTEKIKDFIHYNKTVKNGWKKNESFLFEFQIYPPQNKLNLGHIFLLKNLVLFLIV